MPAGELVRGIIAVIAGYLLGSFPTAYLVTRLKTGQDVRRLGGGNVGALNTLREVGVLPALAVLLTDVGKGSAAAALAYWTLALPQGWVLAAALAAVIGHNWMVWLGFRGGKGAGVTVGTLLVLLPVYGSWTWLAVLGVVLAVPLVITRNVSLAVAAGLIAMPLIAWLGLSSGKMVIWSLFLAMVMVVKYYPSARQAWPQNGNLRDFIFDRWLREKK